jgi:hypothetical protein
MDISSFDDLLGAARLQPEPQRLLFVFAGTELTDDSTPEQREQFRLGQGGALIPLMSVDKTPDEIVDFSQLEAESRQFGHNWVMVFVAGLSGRNGKAPTPDEAQKPLESMVASIKAGTFGAFMPFDRMGHPVLFS